MSLNVSDIHFSYGKTPILHGVDFEVASGTFCALLGPNGSGKSTLAKILARVHAPARGSVTLDGVDLLALSRKEAARRVSYVPQSSEIPFELTVRDAVLLGRTPHIGLRPTVRDWDIVDDAIAQLGLESLAGRSIDALSGGQAQRVLVARALAQEPQVLLLDEPTSALDLRYQVETLQLIQRITHERGISAVIAIHDLAHAAFFCDQAILLQGGRIISDGHPTESLTSRLVSDVYGIGIVVEHRDDRSDIRPEIFEAGRARRTQPRLLRSA